MILDDEYEKVDLNKPIKKLCQFLMEDQQKYLFNLLQNFEELFNGKIG